MAPGRRGLVLAVGLALAASSPLGCHAGGASADAGAEAASHASADASKADATAARDAALDPTEALARGALLYGRYCGFCHGENGKGYKADQAPALANDDFLTIASDDYLRDTILKGRPGTTMSAWSKLRGGPVSDVDASAIVTYLRSWQTRAAAPPAATTTVGDASNAPPVYAANCTSCHGTKGRDGKYNALGNPELLAAASDAFLATTIERGRAGTPMNAFQGKLSSGQIADLVALIRSWQVTPDGPVELPPDAGALSSIVLNPKGPQPAFDAQASFVPVDTVKQEVDRNASMILVDARPPADYARMHIAGAISIPFFRTADYAKQLPKDRYIITYCACPHAESGQVRDALRKLDYPRVAVLDEGLNVWRDRGYPVRGGPKP